MKTKEKFQIAALGFLIIVMIVMYFTGYGAHAVDVNNDGKTFKVLKCKYDEGMGYTPFGETSMNMDQLRSWVKICYFTSDRLESGDVMINFEADPKERWIVVISDPDVLRELNAIEEDYRLKCSIPD